MGGVSRESGVAGLSSLNPDVRADAGEADREGACRATGGIRAKLSITDIDLVESTRVPPGPEAVPALCGLQCCCGKPMFDLHLCAQLDPFDMI